MVCTFCCVVIVEKVALTGLAVYGRLEVGCGGRWHRASWRLRWRSAAASDLFHPDSPTKFFIEFTLKSVFTRNMSTAVTGLDATETSTDRVVVDVGGTKFTTSVTTL